MAMGPTVKNIIGKVSIIVYAHQWFYEYKINSQF